MLNVHLKQKACKDSEIYFTHSRGKKQPTDNVPNEAQTLDLIVSDIKSSVKNMFKELKKVMFKEVKERIKVMSHQIDINNEKLFKKTRYSVIKKGKHQINEEFTKGNKEQTRAGRKKESENLKIGQQRLFNKRGIKMENEEK